MPQRLLQCRLCGFLGLQTTPDVPSQCEGCPIGTAAHWRVYEALPKPDEFLLTESDTRFLKSLRIVAA